MKKETIIKIISTVVCLGVIIGGYFIIKHISKNQGGNVTIILSDPFNDYYNEKTIKFKKDQNLADILKEHYECNITTSGLLIDLEGLHTADDFSTFIYIYINGEDSYYGVQQYYPQDGDIVKFEIVAYDAQK